MPCVKRRLASVNVGRHIIPTVQLFCLLCSHARAGEKSDFPNTYGPFTMMKTSLTNEDFVFTSNIDGLKGSTFVVADHDEDHEWSNHGCGDELDASGGHTFAGRAGPLAWISFSQNIRENLGIPDAAQEYCYAQPNKRTDNQALQKGDANENFCNYGGYLFFDEEEKIVAVFSKAKSRHGLLAMSRPKKWEPEWTEKFLKLDRVWRTHEGNAVRDTEHVIWLMPGEDPVRAEVGAFVFLFHDPANATADTSKDVYFDLLGRDQYRGRVEGSGETAAIVLTVAIILEGMFCLGVWKWERGVKRGTRSQYNPLFGGSASARTTDATLTTIAEGDSSSPPFFTDADSPKVPVTIEMTDIAPGQPSQPYQRM